MGSEDVLFPPHFAICRKHFPQDPDNSNLDCLANNSKDLEMGLEEWTERLCVFWREECPPRAILWNYKVIPLQSKIQNLKLFGALLKSHNSWVAEKKTWQKLKGVCVWERWNYSFKVAMIIFVKQQCPLLGEKWVIAAIVKLTIFSYKLGKSWFWFAFNIFSNHIRGIKLN